MYYALFSGRWLVIATVSYKYRLLAKWNSYMWIFETSLCRLTENYFFRVFLWKIVFYWRSCRTQEVSCYLWPEIKIEVIAAESICRLICMSHPLFRPACDEFHVSVNECVLVGVCVRERENLRATIVFGIGTTRTTKDFHFLCNQTVEHVCYFGRQMFI